MTPNQQAAPEGEQEIPRRFAGLYALAWAPYLVAYGAVLQASMALPIGLAAMGAAANGLPPALLGWWALGLGRRTCQLGGRGRFWALHGAAAAVYAAASMVGTWLLFQLFHRLKRGSWDAPLWHLGPLLWQLLICSLLYAVLAGLGHAWTLRDRLQREETRTALARELAARSQLQALRARLDPHFLFNTLHSLLALVRRDPSAAEEGLERLGDLLHYALRARGAEGDEVTLSEERDFISGYLELEALRLGERLVWEDRIEAAALACRLPAFTLQPLVENAIRHGVAQRARTGKVSVSGSVRAGTLLLEVRDDGPGAERQALGVSGQGLDLVRQRLRADCGDRARMEIDTAPGQGFRVRLQLPAEGGPGETNHESANRRG